MDLPRAIILSALLFSATAAVLLRYDAAQGLLLDRWTGKVLTCSVPDAANVALLRAAGFSEQEISDQLGKVACR